jgi:hypothetical protein
MAINLLQELFYQFAQTSSLLLSLTLVDTGPLQGTSRTAMGPERLERRRG